MQVFLFLVLFVFSSREIAAHFAAWHPGMYCLKGTSPDFDDMNNNRPVQPIWDMPFQQWWFNHATNCDQFPPDEGVFLELPANGQFTVEHATNRAFTTLDYSNNGANAKTFGNGQDAIGQGLQRNADGSMPCITDPNIHTQNETMAAGTAFAISYVSEISQVTRENLVIFTTLDHTPWKRIATYDVPDLPACPKDGCICAWGWVPNGCGEPNMYMQGFKCKVTGNTGSKALATPSPATWCEDNQDNCTKGAKQMIYWNQAEMNNIEVSGFDLSGQPRSPAYNNKLGFANGAQHDIFVQDATMTTTYIPGTATATSTDSSRDNYASHVVLPIPQVVISILITSALIVSSFTWSLWI